MSASSLRPRLRGGFAAALFAFSLLFAATPSAAHTASPEKRDSKTPAGTEPVALPQPSGSLPEEILPPAAESSSDVPAPVGFGAKTYSAVVRASRDHSTASATRVRNRDLRLRPVRRASDLIQVTPGLIAIQHAGGGKANQYLMRGFDLDHGTDIALSVDGIPVNMVSHAHGQGYADLNWVIPETIERVEVRKGPYFAEGGDFGLAGAVNLVTRGRLRHERPRPHGGALRHVPGRTHRERRGGGAGDGLEALLRGRGLRHQRTLPVAREAAAHEPAREGDT